MFAVAGACVGSPGTDATQPFRILVADAIAVCRGEKPAAVLDRSYGSVLSLGAVGAAGGGGFVSARTLRPHS
jgi:hypothetical protein